MPRYRPCIKPAAGIDERMTPAEIVRFLKFVKVDPVTGCWLWTGYTDDKGYGQFWWRGKARWAYRLSYVTFTGIPLLDGEQADHNDPDVGCHRSGCVCPDHIRPTSHGENSADANRRRAVRRREEEAAAEVCEVPF